MEANASSTTLKKKTPKGAFHGPADGSFFQKKKAVFGNIKHSGNKRDIFLSKSGSDNSVYSDVESLSGEDKNVSMFGVNVNTDAGFGSLLGSPDFYMDDEKVVLPSCLPIFLEKKWIDPKIIKTSVEVLIKKSFALDINLSAVEGKSAMAKTQLIRKIFSTVNEKNIEMATSLAREKETNVNTNLRKSGVCSDWTIVIKEIPIDTLKEMIVAAVAEFGEIKSIKIQLIGMWQKAVVKFAKSSQADQLVSRWSFLIRKNLIRVAKAVGDHDTWASKNWFKALLFTLPMGTTAHDLGTFLDKTGGKTCTINQSLTTGNRVCCAVVGFESEVDLDSTFRTEPVFDSVQLSWARLDLVRYGKCGRFGHSALECNTFDVSVLTLSKNVLISCSTVFGSKLWAQVVSLASFSGGSPSGFGYGLGFFSSGALGLGGSASFFPIDKSPLVVCLAFLEHSLELLADQISGIFRKLSFVELVPMVLSSGALFLVSSVLITPVLDSDMALDSVLALFSPPPSSVELDAGFNLSSSKVLTTKIGGLESKMLAMEALVSSVLAKLDLFGLVWKIATCNVQGINVSAKQKNIVCWHRESENLVLIVTEMKLRSSFFTSGSDAGFLGAGVAIIMNISIARHVCKISEMPDQLFSIKLLFKNRLSVSILGFYAGASSAIQFSQASKINFFVAKTVNNSFFIILGGDFNEDGLHKSASFKRCLNLGLVNSLSGSPVVNSCTWRNSRGVNKTIDYILVLSNLINAVMKCTVVNVSEHFDTDHQTVSVSLGLDELLDVHLCFLCKQANRDRWKFDLKSADKNKWVDFKCTTKANMTMFSDEFAVIHKIMVLSANEDFDVVFTKDSSRFYKLELLISKIVKAYCGENVKHFESLMKCWKSLDGDKALVIWTLVTSDVNSGHVCSALMGARKFYHYIKEINIKSAVDKKMESFEVNKGYLIRSMLECLFHKMVLNHLVVDDELILESGLIKFKVNIIMEGWTRKYQIVDNVSDVWCCQYHPLKYVFDEAFSGVMCLIGFDELFRVVSDLPNNKTAACSAFDVLCEDNFSVLKGMTTQFSIFAIGSVIENVLEKDYELWLVLQDMQKAYDLWWKRLSLRGPISEWFKLATAFLNSVNSTPTGPLVLGGIDSLNILRFHNFVSVRDHLSRVSLSDISVYTDGSLKNLGTAGCKAGAAAFFEDIGLGLNIGISGLMSSTLAELQAIALALECVLLSSSVYLFSDSQSVLNVCKTKLGLVCPDFHN
ncbi:hypothetical protein G9A89_017536 [Geosiphon pyriformis]|nr:hypothetical protein G9A89_017536 [Geosiphon pyriformis]